LESVDPAIDPVGATFCPLAAAGEPLGSEERRVEAAVCANAAAAAEPSNSEEQRVGAPVCANAAAAETFISSFTPAEAVAAAAAWTIALNFDTSSVKTLI